MNQIEPKSCMLRLHAEGQSELCPRERCAFWELGGAVVEGNCVIDRLGADVRDPAVAGYLLEARARLERVRDLAAAEQAYREFSHRLGYEL
jgi:hypothetical protein